MNALAEHVVSQTRQNVDFLVQHGHISQADANTILGRLPDPTAAAPQETVRSFTPAATHVPPARARVAPPPPPPPTSAPSLSLCKAEWAYESNDPNDLSFAAGDVITVVEETNQDWWKGSLHGRTGLFPSNHVQKIPVSQPAPYTADTSDVKPAYKPFGAAYHGMDAPPPSGSGATNSVGLQEAPKKKGKLGGFGNTIAHSAAGGVGFGAGAAIGSGIIGAIF